MKYLSRIARFQTLIVVHDSKGNKWSVEHRVTKVKIEPIREIYAFFGLTKQPSENQ